MLGVYSSNANKSVNSSRTMLWDEENHLLALSDNGFVSNYFYDAAGERTVKMSGANEGVVVNGVLSGAQTGTTNFTAYISPYLVLNNGGYYSKHIYIGSQRITSKLGSSDIFVGDQPFEEQTAQNKDFSNKYLLQITKIKERCDSLGVAYHGKPLGLGIETSIAGLIATPLLYFYHSDHLGSSSLITDGGGSLVQHIEYVPFGEVFVEERNSGWSTPYKFNGKEMDEETGLYYYGARYMDPRTSVWLSVDPLAQKFANFGSYVYCYNNPIRYIDPDGMKGEAAWPIIGPVIPKGKFVGWGQNPFYTRFVNYNNKEPQCADYAKEQLRIVGFSTGGAGTKSNIYLYDEKKGVNVVETKKAITYIKEQITKGIPVFVGVDDKKDSKLNEGTTDHFAVIVGMGSDKKGNYFSFYDNASGDESQGTNPNNRLYYDEKTGKIKGKSQTVYANTPGLYNYILSQVRKTTKKNNKQ